MKYDATSLELLNDDGRHDTDMDVASKFVVSNGLPGMDGGSSGGKENRICIVFSFSQKNQ